MPIAALTWLVLLLEPSVSANMLFPSNWKLIWPCCSADDGVSIPGEYTSFLAPISSSKLYNEVRACREKDRDPEVKSCFSGMWEYSLVFSIFFCGADEEVKEIGTEGGGWRETVFLSVSLILGFELPLGKLVPPVSVLWFLLSSSVRAQFEMP